MPYIDRDGKGNVIATYARIQSHGQEFVEDACIDESIDQKIASLEASVTPRNLRGAALGDQFAIDKIQAVEDEIKALRE